MAYRDTETDLPEWLKPTDAEVVAKMKKEIRDLTTATAQDFEKIKGWDNLLNFVRSMTQEEHLSLANDLLIKGDSFNLSALEAAWNVVHGVKSSPMGREKSPETPVSKNS